MPSPTPTSRLRANFRAGGVFAVTRPPRPARPEHTSVSVLDVPPVMLSTVLFSLSYLMASVTAAPTFLSEAVVPDGTLIVVDPEITSPTADTVWVVGNKYSVTW